MSRRLSFRRRNCMAITAEFVFGPQRCNAPTHHLTRWDGVWWPVCKDHR